MPYRLLRSILKGMHVIGKEKTLGQGLGNTATLALLPQLHTGSQRQRLVVQQELGLPRWGRLGGGRNPRTDLGLLIADYNPPCWLGKSLNGNISRTERWLVGEPLLLTSLPSLRRGWRVRHLAPTLGRWGLHGLPCAGHKAVNGHNPP